MSHNNSDLDKPFIATQLSTNPDGEQHFLQQMSFVKTIEKSTQEDLQLKMFFLREINISENEYKPIEQV